jgi:UDP-N-acetylmuramate dehydrogenase
VLHPIQNIGAYGVELSDVFYDAVCINRKTGESRIFNAEDCDFGYRDSAFKNDLKEAYVVTAVRLALTKKNHSLKTDYGSVTETLAQMGVTKPNIEDVAKAVIQIRTSKLPDPKKLGNAGSFFKNPIVTKGRMRTFYLLQYPNMPYYQIDGAFDKIPAGWLIEQAGFKGLKKGKSRVCTTNKHWYWSIMALLLENCCGNTPN